MFLRFILLQIKANRRQMFAQTRVVLMNLRDLECVKDNRFQGKSGSCQISSKSKRCLIELILKNHPSTSAAQDALRTKNPMFDVSIATPLQESLPA
ncbi:hypothetical protein Zmor_022553 [Zophobas morio]|uniref:Uncharacterized protein n=1 Tax=Zophobas morio TaxID=2755281 RepID=A0AA38HX27_9CUCU|nr:hypothetical protein Zmor_022553 [Zophobas morio]